MFKIEEINLSPTNNILRLKANRTSISLAEGSEVIKYFTNRDWQEEANQLDKLIREYNLIRYSDIVFSGFNLLHKNKEEYSIYVGIIDKNCFEITYFVSGNAVIEYQVSKVNVVNLLRFFCDEDYNSLIKLLNSLQNDEKVPSENWKILKEREEKFDKEYKHGQIFRIGFIIILFVALLLLNFLFDKEYKNTQFLLIYSVCALIISLFLLRYNRLI